MTNITNICWDCEGRIDGGALCAACQRHREAEHRPALYWVPSVEGQLAPAEGDEYVWCHGAGPSGIDAERLPMEPAERLVRPRKRPKGRNTNKSTGGWKAA
jgi:hypothetical protein|tara:strand:- start:1254 stop:1556 length:303 start_codon:yes stop_codon:yes gene_type:complete